MSRRSALTADVRKQIVRAVSSGAPDAVAAQSCGVHPSTLGEWRRRGVEAREVRESGGRVAARERPFLLLVDEIDEAVARVEVAAWAVVQREARMGDWRAARFLLECMNPEAGSGRGSVKAGKGKADRAGVGGRPVGSVSAPDRVARPGEPPRLKLVEE